MKKPTQEDLLGYLLGALDADEQAQLQQKIDSDPQLDERLLEVKSTIAPLELLSEQTGVRPGLARRTCEMVASHTHADDIKTAPKLTESVSPASLHRWSSWSLTDLLVAAASVAIFASLLFPMLAYTKHRSNLAHCSNNLQSIGTALASFSEINNGRFVEIPSEGPLAFAGVVAPILKEAQFIEEDNLFTCRAVSRDKPFMIPSTDQIRRCSTGEEGDYFRRISSGDYGYSFGYMEGDKYCSPRNMGRAYAVIAADKPSIRNFNAPSDNHGGGGQNCLFEDFSVRYVAGSAIADDQIYVNSYNVVGPGISPRDSVIASSHLAPLPVTATLNQIGIAE